MTATKDIPSSDRPEGFVSSGQSSSLNTSVDVISKISVEIVEAKIQGEDALSGKAYLESTGKAAAGHDEIVLSSEKLEMSVGADDLRASFGDAHQDLQVNRDSSVEKSVLDSSKENVTKELSAIGTSAASSITPGTHAVNMSTVESHAAEKCNVETHSMETPNLETHGGETPTVEQPAKEVALKTDPKEEVAPLFGSIPAQDVVQGAIPDANKMDTDSEGAMLKYMPKNEVGGEQESSPSSLMNERLNVASPSTLVKESPLIGTHFTSSQPLDGSEGLQNGETRMDEVVSVTNHIITSSTIAATILENEVNSKNGDTTGKTVDETAEKLADKMANRMVNQLADGVADRMADAIADEIADEIADRMADEIANKMADEMADGMADEIANKMADRMADEMADRLADEMADRMADEMADRMADEMADRMADEMAAEMADELADEMADEVIEGVYSRGERAQENERMDDGETHEVGDMEEEQMGDDGNKEMDDVDYEDDEGTPDEQMLFVEELERFFKQRNLEYKPPKFYGLELNVLKLWRVVSRYGGYDQVTVSKLWRTVGEEFKPPKTCTTISWSFRGFYEKALLDYERFKTGVSAPDNGQRAIQTPGYYLTNDQRTASPATPSSDPNAGGTPGSGSGRARRDAAARAMQGWHSQRMGNGDSKEPTSKEKSSGGKHVKKERKLTNIGGNGLKRKGSNTVLERAVKAVQARGRPRLFEESPPSNSAVTGKRSMKQQDSGRRPVKVAKLDGPVGGFDPPIVDEGPKADWVKINVHKHLDCFEIYALVPGLAREEVRIQCEPGGRLVIAGMPEDPENPWGVTPFRKVISLPSRIDAHQTSAVVTLYGQLYVRVPIAEDKSS
ncbi:uncharacterized protein [Physcomitrium patens]|nr:AT-rich interactive domain-containing protein 3-like isoform X2 [Physcomitrium patens]|eukprot:XP_024396670.1 AT-rich interactive domain-containing protein 3-like isoform X2 [Physcomitrella patens]